ncbi:MAG: M10 family metallopeptidase C-terminal domain-containing protein [Allosphingosinicella sp.]|uniref:M10 family metallopeptidase C-terminal domain-containing protein n=1 Tax=Allosphingosinicella sp. TaxID=2823234 RepID=UPI003945217B
MCWICEGEQRSSLAMNYWANQLGLSSLHYEAAARDLGEVLIGSDTGLIVIPPGVITIDNVPDDISSTVTLSVGQTIVNTLDYLGDQDFFRVELVAGKTYEIGQYAHVGGPMGVPLADAYLELYDATGKLLVVADGGGPNTPSGLDALLTFTPQASGTYFINARAYDELPVPGATGDFVGDYQLFLREASPFSYKPYYKPDSPLYALDWGSQVKGSSRNPDGEEGPRETGNPFTGHAWNPYGITGKNVITYYFAKAGDVFVDEDPTNPGLTTTMIAAGMEQWEKDAFVTAFKEYEKVADIVYIETQNRYEADFKIVTYKGTPGPGASLLGRMSPPGERNAGQTEVNSGDERWNPEGLAPGGFTFVTLIHELGHGHGMAHPHDGGGRSGVMNGVTSRGAAFSYTTGDFGLNQGVYTMMSYEDGWVDSPYGQASTNAGYGWLGGLMAFDIAVIQDKYGVNEEWATGNDTYVLKDVNAPGTFFYSIWDAGGIDEITYSGSRDAVIDLRPATLKYEVGGGGYVSHVWGIHGGFTIANGVTIENASSGSGNDRLIGNEAANILRGNAGNDVLEGRGGDDKLYGGAGDDELIGGDGNDLLDGGAGIDIMRGGKGDDTYVVDNSADVVIELAGEGTDTVFSRGDYTLAAGSHVEILRTTAANGTAAVKLTGNEIANTIYGNAGDNELRGMAGDDKLYGGDGNDLLDGGAGNDLLVGGRGDDTYIIDNPNDVVIELPGEGTDTIFSRGDYTLGAGVHVEILRTTAANGTNPINFNGNEIGNTIYGNAGANTLRGMAGDDVLYGLGGDDKLFGGTGNDRLIGGAGKDGFHFDTALNMSTNVDHIVDFSPVDDTIFLDRSIFSGIGENGTLNSNAFRTGSFAFDADDRIIYNSATGSIFYDPDGAGGVEAVLFATVAPGTALTHLDFVAYTGG